MTTVYYVTKLKILTIEFWSHMRQELCSFGWKSVFIWRVQPPRPARYVVALYTHLISSLAAIILHMATRRRCLTIDVTMGHNNLLVHSYTSDEYALSASTSLLNMIDIYLYFLSFVWFEELRTEVAGGWTECKAPWGKFVILGNLNKKKKLLNLQLRSSALLKFNFQNFIVVL